MNTGFFEILRKIPKNGIGKKSRIWENFIRFWGN